MQPAPTDGKAAWRAWARELRATLPDASAAICDRITALIDRLRPGTVLAYHAFGNEVSLDELADRYPTLTWLAPRVNRGGELSLHRWEEAVASGPFGIRQAAANAAPVAPDEVDLALVPGLVFDERGFRVGYGRGYYDRLLPRLPVATPRIGVAREALIVPAVPTDPWDYPLTHLASENRLVAVAPVPFPGGR